jgi:hypothetical protein
MPPTQITPTKRTTRMTRGRPTMPTFWTGATRVISRWRRSTTLIYTDECDTAATWNECAIVQVIVPAGQTVHVSVWNHGTALTASDINAEICAVRRASTETDPSCISPFGATAIVTLSSGKFTAFSSSGETTIGPGTWNFSLGFKPTAQMTVDDFGKVTTKILVRDASGPGPLATSSGDGQGGRFHVRSLT